MTHSALTPVAFAERLKLYCETFSGSVTSWGRTVEHNRDVGGVARSAHLAWLAADVVYDGSVPGGEADTWLREHELKRITEGDHDHLMPADWKA